MTYFNTNQTEGQILIDFNVKSKSLEEKVYDLFVKRQIPLTWCYIFHELSYHHEISIKRSISNLKTAGKLEKVTDKSLMVMGIYGKKVHLYRLTK